MPCHLNTRHFRDVWSVQSIICHRQSVPMSPFKGGQFSLAVELCLQGHQCSPEFLPQHTSKACDGYPLVTGMQCRINMRSIQCTSATSLSHGWNDLPLQHSSSRIAHSAWRKVQACSRACPSRLLHARLPLLVLLSPLLPCSRSDSSAPRTMNQATA